MIGHKERTFFYPLQLRDFVREHGAALPIGVPIALDALRQERYCIVRPNRFRFYHELCGANGLPLNFFISMRHIINSRFRIQKTVQSYKTTLVPRFLFLPHSRKPWS